jgi:[citrate (pro-3S)-lyase] ligase
MSNSTYYALGKYLNIRCNGSSPIDYLIDIGVKKVYLYGDSPVTRLMLTTLLEALFPAEAVGATSFLIRSPEGTLLKAITLELLETKLNTTENNKEAIVICDSEIPLDENQRIKLLFPGRVYSLDYLLNYAIAKCAFVIPLENHIIKQNIRISVFFAPSVSVNDVNKPSLYEKLLLSSQLSSEKKQIVRSTRQEIYSPKIIDSYKLHQQTGGAYELNGIVHYTNICSEYLNRTDDERLTISQPTTYSNTIWFFGNSFSSGRFVKDGDTIQSHLQNIINENVNKRMIVRNYPRGGGNSVGKYPSLLSILPIKNNDIVIFMLSLDLSFAFTKINTKSCLQRPHNMGEIFIDKTHVNGVANYKIAEYIFEELFAYGVLDGENPKNLGTLIPPNTKHLELDSISDSDLLAYVEKLKKTVKVNGENVGAIVMNCNPFTSGHQYLIETCASKVETLIVFVVEEERSIFPFTDRLKLIKYGIVNLHNVQVVPSGKFIISTQTFPEYFEKEDIQKEVIDPALDVILFAQHIAPALGITVRFAGEEPIDSVTRQYNETMAQILPEFGVGFQEIPRKEFNGVPISASLVRSLLTEQNFEEIAKIVPQTTLDYLVDKYATDRQTDRQTVKYST